MARFTEIAILSTLVLALLGCQSNEQDPPLNILLIHADQHRMDCIGAYGNPDVQTPNLDQLAKDGVLYHNAYCTLPVCTPSRYSLLTGQHVQEHQGWTNRSTLNPDIETLPDLLKKAGYRTKAIGKMHFTPTYLDVGFEELTLAEQDGGGRWDDDYHRDLMDNSLVDAIDLEDQRQEYPKGYHAGSKRSDLTSNIDVAPTILNSVGLEIPTAMSGLNLRDTSVQRTYVFAHAWLGSQAMARSERYKLILNKNGPSLFFDLEKDPLELNNLFSDADYQNEIQVHQQAILDWQGTDNLAAENYLNLDAPVILQPNVRTYKDGHRDTVITYFKQKMIEYQK